MKKLIKQLLFAIVCMENHTAFAYVLGSPSFKEVSDQALAPIGFLILAAHKICWILGGAFMLGAVVQYLKHRRNAGETPISQPVLLALLGLFLIGLPLLLQKIYF
jgi:hypothetical protein